METSLHTRQVVCVFSVRKSIRNGHTFFIEGKENNYVLSKAGYLKRNILGQNPNVRKEAVGDLWKRNLWKESLIRNQVLICDQADFHQGSSD